MQKNIFAKISVNVENRSDFYLKILIINMKTLNLSLYDVEKMDETRMSEVRGGGFWWFIAGAICGGGLSEKL